MVSKYHCYDATMTPLWCHYDAISKRHHYTWYVLLFIGVIRDRVIFIIWTKYMPEYYRGQGSDSKAPFGGMLWWGYGWWADLAVETTTSTSYTIHCTLYTIYNESWVCILYSSVYSVRYVKMYTIHCTLLIVYLSIVDDVQCIVYTMYSVQCSLQYNVYYAVWYAAMCTMLTFLYYHTRFNNNYDMYCNNIFI